MEIIIKNERLRKLLKEKETIWKAGMEQKKQWDDIQEEMRKTGMKIERIKEKIIPIVERETKGMITDEFEEIDLIKFNDKGEIVITTFNRIEALKDELRKRKEQAPVDPERPVKPEDRETEEEEMSKQIAKESEQK